MSTHGMLPDGRGRVGRIIDLTLQAAVRAVRGGEVYYRCHRVMRGGKVEEGVGEKSKITKLQHDQ